MKKNLFKFAYATLAVAAMIAIGQGSALADGCTWRSWTCGTSTTQTCWGDVCTPAITSPVICYACE